jgi:hypothetical protein
MGGGSDCKGVDAFNNDELTSTGGGEIVGTTTRDLQQARFTQADDGSEAKGGGS